MKTLSISLLLQISMLHDSKWNTICLQQTVNKLIQTDKHRSQRTNWFNWITHSSLSWNEVIICLFKLLYRFSSNRAFYSPNIECIKIIDPFLFISVNLSLWQYLAYSLRSLGVNFKGLMKRTHWQLLIWTARKH